MAAGSSSCEYEVIRATAWRSRATADHTKLTAGSDKLLGYISARLLRIRCTMQLWTSVWGVNRRDRFVIASGKPLRPSMAAIRISFTPRTFSSFMTLSQTFAPGSLELSELRGSSETERLTRSHAGGQSLNHSRRTAKPRR
jgi:hypothetical protein